MRSTGTYSWIRPDLRSPRPKQKAVRREDPGPTESQPDWAAVPGAFRRAQKGDPAACRAFLEMLSLLRTDLILGVIEKRGLSWHDAEDGVAQVFLGLFAQLLGGNARPPRQNWRTFLLLRSRQEAWKARRSAKATSEKSRAEEDEDGVRPPRYLPEIELWGRLPEDAKPLHRREEACLVELKDEVEAVKLRALMRLPVKQRRVFLAGVEGLSVKEVAALVGIGPSSVKVYRARAKRKLREWLRIAG